MRGLYALKPWYTRQLAVFVRSAVDRGWSPDLFTGIGLAGAALAALAIAYGWWPAAALLLAIRLAGANLDGAVARARGVARPWGFVLNELGDRGSDVLAFAGLAALAMRTGADLTLVLLAAAVATLPTFISLAAAGAGAPRHNGGPLGKTERCALFVVAAAVSNWIPIICWVIVVGSVVTGLARLLATHRELTTAQVAS